MQPHTPVEQDAKKRSSRRHSRLRQDQHGLISTASDLLQQQLTASLPARNVSHTMDAKRPAMLQDITNHSKSRKRAETASASDEDSVQSGKKNKRMQQTAAVTPLTAMDTKHKTSSTLRFGDIAPVVQQLLLQPEKPAKYSPLPAGVVDLYRWDRSKLCACDVNHCSSQSLSHSFVRHYGRDYSRFLRDLEETYFPSLRTSANSSASSSESTSSSSSSLSQAELSALHQGTPPRRVNYVFGCDVDEDQQSLNPSVTSQSLPNQPHLSNRMREVLVDWLIELSEEYQLHTRTLHLTVALLNRTLECGKEDSNEHPFHIHKDMFQCLGCACMWMASKIEEITSPSVDDFIYISADSYSRQDMTSMEVLVCDALNFRLFQVTPHHFVEELLRASNANRPSVGCPIVDSDVERSMVEYLLELSCLPFSLSTIPPRLVASAAMYLSRIVLGLEGWSPTLEHVTDTCHWDLEDVVLVIYKYYSAAEESTLTNAFQKYSKSKHHFVALKTVPLQQYLGF